MTEKARCEVCFRGCELAEGAVGFCGARANEGGAIRPVNYGMAAALALDPIEKKPLARFFPGSEILSYGSFGCNLRCPFCQNHELSYKDPGWRSARYISPEELCETARSLRGRGNIGAAFTYNEPLICPEYLADCARLLRSEGMKTVAVTNGEASERTAREVLPLLDALNIDLKCFTDGGYRRLGGDLDTVKRFIELAAKECHVELTTLVVPGLSDSAREMAALSGWVASLSEDIPLHVTRFFPRWRMSGAEPTPVETVYRLAETAKKNLRYVCTGNC